MKKVGFLRNRFVDGSLWFIATSRNAIAVIAGCLAAYFLEQNGSKPFTLTGLCRFYVLLFLLHYKIHFRQHTVWTSTLCVASFLEKSNRGKHCDCHGIR